MFNKTIESDVFKRTWASNILKASKQFKNTLNEYQIYHQQNCQNSTFLTKTDSSFFDHHYFPRYVYIFFVDLEYRRGKNSQKRTIIE